MNRPACIAFHAVLTPEQIKNICAVGDKAMQKAATVVDADPLHRRSLVSWFPPTGEVKAIVHHVNEARYQFDLWDVEPLQYTVYSEGGYYGWHMDLGPGPAQRRKLSLTIQLSDPSEYEGGDFEAQTGSEVITGPKERGTVIAFPSWIIHRVTPVTRGIRRSLVVWATGEPFR